MPRYVSVREFRQRMADILGQEEVVVTKDGIPLARVIPLDPVERFLAFLEQTKACFADAQMSDADIQEMYAIARGKKR